MCLTYIFTYSRDFVDNKCKLRWLVACVYIGNMGCTTIQEVFTTLPSHQSRGLRPSTAPVQLVGSNFHFIRNEKMAKADLTGLLRSIHEMPKNHRHLDVFKHDLLHWLFIYKPPIMQDHWVLIYDLI